MKPDIDHSLLLKILAQNNGILNWPEILNHIKKAYFPKTYPSKEAIAHEYYLLEKEGAVEKVEPGHDGQVWYKITPWGHAKLMCFVKKFWFYILHNKNHNLLAILSLVIAVLALIKSFWK